MAADEVAHVLHDAHDRHIHFAEHGQALARVDQGDVLRGGDDDGAGEWHLLGHGQLRVAGAGREIDDHEIELSPLHVSEELVECLHHHRSAPDDRGVGIGDQPEGHRLDAVVLHRHDLLVVIDGGPAFDAEHHLLRGSIDVGVEQTDGVAESAERKGQVGGDGRLADPSLSGSHGDLEADLLQHRGGSAGGPDARRGLSRPDIQLHAYVGDAGDLSDRLIRFFSDLCACTGVLGLEANGEEHGGAVDAHVMHEPEGDNVAGQPRKLDRFQRFKNLFRGRHGFVSPVGIARTKRG